MTLKELKEALENCSDNEDYDVVFESDYDIFDVGNIKVSKIRHEIILKKDFGN